MDKDVYEIKFDLLLKKYNSIQIKNDKLQNRIYHVRKQIRYMRSLKRIIIQKLLVYGDRFMDVCLEIPDMEPGANVEDRIIDVVAEAPPKPPISPVPAVPAKKKRTDSVHRRPSQPKVVIPRLSDPAADLSKSLNLEEIVNSVIHESKQPHDSSVLAEHVNAGALSDHVME